MKTFYHKIHKNMCPQIVSWSHATFQDIAQQDILKATKKSLQVEQPLLKSRKSTNFMQLILETRSLTTLRTDINADWQTETLSTEHFTSCSQNFHFCDVHCRCWRWQKSSSWTSGIWCMYCTFLCLSQLALWGESTRFQSLVLLKSSWSLIPGRKPCLCRHLCCLWGQGDKVSILTLW